jgi:predicted Co/Zn/Cd cation transporter (cation efflux family)
MRTLGIIAAAVVGAAFGFLMGALVGVAIPNSIIPAGVCALIGMIGGGILLAILVAQLVPVDPRKVARNEERLQQRPTRALWRRVD